MPITINGAGTITGINVGGLEDGIVTPAELSTGAPSWDAQYNLTNIASLNGGALAGTRNRIINGDMRIAQRGTSFAAANGYTLDRWGWYSAGAMVCTVSQSSDVPNNTFQSSYKVDVTTADTSIAVSDFAALSQSIEGYNVRDLIGTTFTLSFWVKSPKTGAHCVGFRNAAVADRSYVKEYIVVAANTWEYKTLTITGGLITAGTWNWTDGQGLNIVFTLACGSTFHTTANAWQTGNFIATANQVNVMDNTANDFFLTGVQLEPGSVATPFERRPIGTELALCQRYYEVFGPMTMMFPWGNATQIVRSHSSFAVTKRAAPTITMGSKTAGSGSAVASNIDTTGTTFAGTGSIQDVLIYTNNIASVEL